MKGIAFVTILTVVMTVGLSASALEPGHGGKDMVVGGYFGLGFAFVAGDGYEEWSGWDRSDRTAKFSGAGGAYFDYYFTSLFGVEAGIGFISNGIRFRDDDWRRKERLFYMEIPILFKADLQHFQITAGFALWVALSGKTTVSDDNTEVDEKWGEDEWQYVHRVNFGPRLAVGYAIGVGPIFIVPGLCWSMHLINDLNRDKIHDDFPRVDEDNLDVRANTLLFTAAVEWPF